MRKFIVEVREVHVSTIEVDADSKEDAISRVKGGDGEQVFCEYSHTLDDDTWAVTEKSA